ncbi:MAG: hypothetical protein LIP06_09075 [Tannerellaceae bacterium]|nr:hypothetical protein [Tannerellaceae bacterium]
MKKEYKHDKEKQGNDRVEEPALVYKPGLKSGNLPAYSIEQMRAQADQAIQQVKEGKVISQEDMRKRHP